MNSSTKIESVYEAWQRTRNITTVYDVGIEKYEAEIKGLEWQISQEKYKPWRDEVKEFNISMLKKELRRAKLNLAKLLTIREASL